MGTTEEQLRRQAASDLILELQKLQGHVRGLPKLVGNAQANVLNLLNQTMKKCSAFVASITTPGVTTARKSLGQQWNLFAQEIQRGRYGEGPAGILTVCIRHSKAISEGK